MSNTQISIMNRSGVHSAAAGNVGFLVFSIHVKFSPLIQQINGQ